MLVIISDLHLSDGTAISTQVDARAFRLLLHDVYALARGHRHIDLVLLGDVFDLLRSERWFRDEAGAIVPLSQRPWGSDRALEEAAPPEVSLRHARAIAAAIIAKNAEALAALRCETPETAPPDGITVRRIFIPGNHDRLYLHDPELRQAMLTALGAVDGQDAALQEEGIFPHRIQMPRYGLLARHGHEWDVWNFERYDRTRAASTYTDAAYLYTPIGDPITTELVARMPYELRLRLQEDPAFAGTAELDGVCKRLQRIEDVRPTLSAFQWVFFEAGRLNGQLPEPQALALRTALADTLATVARDFLAMDFYHAWHDRHNVFGWIDEADKLHLLLTTVQRFLRFDFADIAKFFGVAEHLLSWVNEDPCQAGAAREELAGLGEAMRCVVYGHTHEPLQVALRGIQEQDLYLNSGTWRDRQYATLDRRGFISWQTFSYIVFYDVEEAQASGKQGPTYERWTGTRGR